MIGMTLKVEMINGETHEAPVTSMGRISRIGDWYKTERADGCRDRVDCVREDARHLMPLALS